MEDSRRKKGPKNMKQGKSGVHEEREKIEKTKIRVEREGTKNSTLATKSIVACTCCGSWS
jgi:hypothetical protein